MAGKLSVHRHGKSRVRVGRRWVDSAGRDVFVEWSVEIALESEADESYLSGDNSSVVATDTMKNMVYVFAKAATAPCSPETFAARLAAYFVHRYDPRADLGGDPGREWRGGKPLGPVTAAHVDITSKEWTRAFGGSHAHGFTLARHVRAAGASVRRGTPGVALRGGLKGLTMLKTRKSSFEGFMRDEYTTLPDAPERLMASEVTATWEYAPGVDPEAEDLDSLFLTLKGAMELGFLGPPEAGVPSPAVQTTLFQMGNAALAADARRLVRSLSLSMPNIHFLPQSAVGPEGKFDGSVFLPTDEPHGTIAATVVRSGGGGAAPASRL